jgi:hypothetical protein
MFGKMKVFRIATIEDLRSNLWRIFDPYAGKPRPVEGSFPQRWDHFLWNHYFIDNRGFFAYTLRFKKYIIGPCCMSLPTLTRVVISTKRRIGGSAMG